jgi:hypothetical protein
LFCNHVVDGGNIIGGSSGGDGVDDDVGNDFCGTNGGLVFSNGSTNGGDGGTLTVNVSHVVIKAYENSEY